MKISILILTVCCLSQNLQPVLAKDVTSIKELASVQRQQWAKLFKPTSSPPWLNYVRAKIPILTWPWAREGMTQSSTSTTTTPKPEPIQNNMENLFPPYAQYDPQNDETDTTLFWQNYPYGIYPPGTISNFKRQVEEPKEFRENSTSTKTEPNKTDELILSAQGATILAQLQPTILKIINNFLIAHDIPPISNSSSNNLDFPEPIVEAAAAVLAVTKRVPLTTAPSVMEEELIGDEDAILKLLPLKILKILAQYSGEIKDEAEEEEQMKELSTTQSSSSVEEINTASKVSELADLLKKFLPPKP